MYREWVASLNILAYGLMLSLGKVTAVKHVLHTGITKCYLPQNTLRYTVWKYGLLDQNISAKTRR